MTNFLTNLISSGASSLVDAVGNAIDKNVTSDEERKALENEIAKADLQYNVQMATVGLQEKQAYLSDTANARDNESRAQESDNASWMAKNIHPILAIGILCLTFFMYWYIVFSDASITVLANNTMKDVVIYILGALTTVATQVVSYYFGSSSGSADKSKTLNTLARKDRVRLDATDN